MVETYVILLEVAAKNLFKWSPNVWNTSNFISEEGVISFKVKLSMHKSSD